MPSATVKVRVPVAPASGVRLRVVQASDVRPRQASERPRTRGECVDGPRPCPWTSCLYHLAEDVQAVARRQASRTGKAPPTLAEMVETCALDVADLGGVSNEAVGVALGMTRENVRQIEAKALAKLEPFLHGLDDATPERSAI